MKLLVLLNVSSYFLNFYIKGSELDQRHYIDPANYLDLMELLSKFTMELNRSDTKLEGLIGQGKY